MDVTSENPVPATRRTVVALAGAGGLAAVLAGCGGAGSGSAAGSGSGSTGSGGSASGRTVLATTSQIPEGGGRIFADQQVVVTQPTAGEFRCFSAICTHQGCTVSQVADGTIDCPCHGSRYRISDGAVVAGPAPRPLPAEKITVTGGQVVLD